MDVLPEHYVVADASSTCYLMMNRSHDENWYLGLPVLKGYYTAFDFVNNKFGLAPLDNSNKRAPTYGPAPTEKLKTGQPGLMKIAAIIASGLVMAALSYFVVETYFLKPKDPTQQQVTVITSSGTVIDTNSAKLL